MKVNGNDRKVVLAEFIDTFCYQGLVSLDDFLLDLWAQGCDGFGEEIFLVHGITDDFAHFLGVLRTHVSVGDVVFSEELLFFSLGWLPYHNIIAVST